MGASPSTTPAAVLTVLDNMQHTHPQAAAGLPPAASSGTPLPPLPLLALLEAGAALVPAAGARAGAKPVSRSHSSLYSSLRESCEVGAGVGMHV
jgi:hypothetical protein